MLHDDSEQSDLDAEAPEGEAGAAADWDIEELFQFDVDKLVGIARQTAWTFPGNQTASVRHLPASVDPRPGEGAGDAVEMAPQQIDARAQAPVPTAEQHASQQTPTLSESEWAELQRLRRESSEFERMKQACAFREKQVERLRRVVCELLCKVQGMTPAAHNYATRGLFAPPHQGQSRQYSKDDCDEIRHNRNRRKGNNNRNSGFRNSHPEGMPYSATSGATPRSNGAHISNAAPNSARNTPRQPRAFAAGESARWSNANWKQNRAEGNNWEAGAHPPPQRSFRQDPNHGQNHDNQWNWAHPPENNPWFGPEEKSAGRCAEPALWSQGQAQGQQCQGSQGGQGNYGGSGSWKAHSWRSAQAQNLVSPRRTK